MLANALIEFEERAVSPALIALAAYQRDEQIIWLMEGLEFVGRAAASALPGLVPLLIPLLSDESFYEPEFWTLDAVGPAAISALPELEKLLRTRRFRGYARSAIWKIAPERSQELQLIKWR